MASNVGRWGRLALLMSGCTLPLMRVQADEIGLFALVGAYDTNNALRTATDERNDVVAYTTLASYGKWESARLRSSWGLAVDGIDYLNGSFGSKIYPSGSISLEHNTIPDLMTWRLRDTTGQILVTPDQPDTPLNVANFNVVSTGPVFHVPLAGHTWVGADALYSNTYYETQTLNGNNIDLSAGFNYELGYKTDIGLWGGEDQGSYDAFGKFRTEAAMVRFNTEGAFTVIKADAGFNRATQPLLTGYLPYFELNLEREFHDTSSFQARLSRKIANPSEEFGQIAGSTLGSSYIHGGSSALDLPNDLDLFDTRLARVAYTTKRKRTEFTFGAIYREEDTLPGAVFPEHRRIRGMDGQYHLVWGSKTGITVYGSYEIHNGELFAGRVDRESVIGAEIAKPLWTVATRWVLTIEHRQRAGNDAINNYHEFRIGAYLRFSKFVFETVRQWQ